MTEREKMLMGQIYDASDKELADRRELAHNLCNKYNMTQESQREIRAEILNELVPHRGKGAFFQGPIAFDYGNNLIVGESFYANFNFTALDCAQIIIGDNVMIGPNCSIVTPIHPLLPKERNIRYKQDGTPYTLEYAKPIAIGNDCWLASNVTVIGGVTIGEGCVIGAGSVVTRDIPPHSFAAGNPCRVIRAITEADSVIKQ